MPCPFHPITGPALPGFRLARYLAAEHFVLRYVIGLAWRDARRPASLLLAQRRHSNRC